MNKESIDPKIVGKTINYIRTKLLGLSMNKFGEKIDALIGEENKTKSGTVSNWEKGRNLPNNERLKAIADLAGITVSELKGENDGLNKKEIGARIILIRKIYKDNLRGFGERIANQIKSEDIPSESIIYRWENGTSIPELTRLKAIAELGFVTIDELLFGQSEANRMKLNTITTDDLIFEVDRRLRKGQSESRKFVNKVNRSLGGVFIGGKQNKRD